MINAKFDLRNLNKVLNNTVKYSNGFIDGVDVAKAGFNQELGQFVREALNRYIDAKARANPESLHHIYEWDMVGQSGARLFDFSLSYTKNLIKFSGKLLPSTTPSPKSGDVFQDKARIMENQITITVEPKESGVIVFENDGETIFTSRPIVIENPGGDSVGGSFENTVSEFFNNYLTAGLLKSSGIFDKLGYPKEYIQRFAQGSKSGRGPGVSAGKEYLNIKGFDIE